MALYIAESGDNIIMASRKAIVDLQATNDEYGVLRFNELDINICRNSNPKDIAEKYLLQHQIRQLESK